MCNFAARPGWRRCCSSAVGASEARADPAVLELLWAEVAQSGVETACVVDFVDESRKILCDVDAQGRSRLPDSIRNLRITPGSQSNPQPDYCPAQGAHSTRRAVCNIIDPRVAKAGKRELFTIPATNHAPAHRADQAVTKQGFPIALRSVLRPAVCVMDATWWRLSPLDGGVKRGKRQANVDRAADCIADHPSRPSVEDHRNIDKATDDGDVRVSRPKGFRLRPLSGRVED